MDRLAVSLQASLLIRNAPAAVADAYCGSRIAGQGMHNIGALPAGIDARAIIERATPMSEKFRQLLAAREPAPATITPISVLSPCSSSCMGLRT